MQTYVYIQGLRKSAYAYLVHNIWTYGYTEESLHIQTYAHIIIRTYSYTDEFPPYKGALPPWNLVLKFLYLALCKSISTVMGLTKQSDLEHVVLVAPM